MRVVAVGAIARRAWVLHLRLRDLLGLVGVAGNAQVLGAGLGQDNFAILGWLVADIALLRRKRIVQERLHQLGSFRLVRIVARETIRRSEGLSLVSLDQTGIPGIVTIDAQRGSVLGQVKIEFALAPFPRLVHGVAGVAAHVQRGVAAAAIRYIRPLRVARQAEIVLLIARGQLAPLVLIVGGVRIVAGQAIANRRRVDFSLDLRGIFVGVASEAELVRRGGDQLYVSAISVDPDFVTAETAHRDCGVHRLALGFVFVAGDADGGIGLGVKRDRMLGGRGAAGEQEDDKEAGQGA